MKVVSILITLALLSFNAIGQQVTPFEDRLVGNPKAKSELVAGLPFTNIGPTIFSGRVSDIEVNEEDPSHFFVSYASGGLWYTDNNGTSFTPLFDHEQVMTIGDFAVNWQDSIIWIGTGEVNSSRSSYAGVGMYVSYDFGKSWEHKGLGESHHIGKVLIDPRDNNNILVSVLGHLYSPNAERGIYQTTDGGNTWSQNLFVDENSGSVDMIRDPKNPDILYASTWHRERRAWNFVESGEGSGIYKSTDGGSTWTLTGNGFPSGEGVGRIGLSIARTDVGTRIYALLDNYDRRPPKDKEEDDLTKADFKSMSDDAFNKLKDEQLKKYLSSNRFPKKYSVKTVRKLFKEEKVKPVDLALYLENANSLLFDTPVVGAELYASDDEGATWYKTHEDYLDAVYNSYGYYFGVVRVNPSNIDEVFVLGVPIIRSIDGGKTFKYIGGDNVHSDHQALWVNPNRDNHIINGNDGGINISYDDGEHWIKCNSPSVGQFYHIAVDMAEPYNVYGGLQDNGVWKGPHTYSESTRWHGNGQYPYESIMGGDGMYTQVDPRDNATIYTGFQFGNYFRLNDKTGDRKRITPSHDLGEAPLRWNWLSPIHLSSHNPDIFYMGANKLFRSFNKGDDFDAISDDLTNGGKKGDVAYGTLTTIHESPLQFGLLYTGSDDGLIHVSPDGGFSWTIINGSLPANLWVSRVQASAHEEDRVYASLNGYRNDDFTPYLYVSENQGTTWTKLGEGLPNHPINVIKEDPVDGNILYLGTDYAAYVSLDRGTTFHKITNGLPNVPVHDIVIHPRDHHILIGTHGRSIYKGDASILRSYADVKDESLIVFEPKETRAGSLAGRKNGFYEREGAKIPLSVYSKLGGNAQVQILSSSDQIVQTHSIDLNPGFNQVQIDGSVHERQKSALEKEEKIKASSDGNYYLPKGEYKVKVVKGASSSEKKLVLK